MLQQGHFGTAAAWVLGAGHVYDETVSRTADGSGSLALSNIPGETSSRTTLTAADHQSRRIYRLKAWVKADGDPGEAAQFRVYMSDATHGGVFACGAYGSLKGLGAEWREYTLEMAPVCAYWHVPEIHAGDTFTIAVHGKNIPADVRVWVDDVTLEPVVREIAIVPTYPNYRGMLWPDQGTTMRWNAVVDPPEGYTTEDLAVSVQLVRADNGEVAAAIESGPLAPVATSGPWISYSVTEMTHDAAALPDGSYYLRGRLVRKADGEVLRTYADYKIVKEDPAVQRAGWKVWVDRHNRVVVNGKPRFIWGGFARFTGARNMFVPNSGAPSSNPDAYRRLANGCNGVPISAPCSVDQPARTPWNRGYGLDGSTFLKEMADVGMNTVLVHAAFNALGVGFDDLAPAGNAAAGTISAAGTQVNGAGTEFGGTVLAGDAIRINHLPATGTITNNGAKVTGTGTRFLTEMEPGDLLTGGAAASWYYVREIYSDTSLMVGGLGTPAWNDVPFTLTRFRRVVSVDPGSQTATIDQAYPGGLPEGTRFAYEKCAPSRYAAFRDAMGPWLAAAQDYDIWYMHNVAHTVGVNGGAWTNASYYPRCHLVKRDDGIEFLTRSRPGSSNGLLGFHVSDEPSYMDRFQGLEHAFEAQRGAARASAGGLTEWSDGGVPTFAFDQWNNILDVIDPDPYPATADALAVSDDIAFGVSGWNKHGRSYSWPRRSGSAVFDSRPLWTTIQLWAWYASYGYATSTYPQPSDMKIQIVSAVAAGSTGLMWWHLGSGSRSLGDRAEDDYLRFRDAAKVVQSVLPILEEPIQDLAGRMDGRSEYGALIEWVSDPDIKCSSRKKGSQVLLACANTTNADKTVTIGLKDPIPGQVTLPWDGSYLEPEGSGFTAQFRGLNGGTQNAGTGLISTGGGQTVVCATACNFLEELAPRDTVTANGVTRMVVSVDSDTQFTVDAPVAKGWTGQAFTYSRDAEKADAVHFFLIETQPAAASESAN